MSYRLVIHDDAEHSFHYVIALFIGVLGVGAEEAFGLAWKVHREGRASVGFYDLSNAREAEERVLSGGLDRFLGGSPHSLVASVERVTGSEVEVLSRGRLGPKGYERLDERAVAALHEQSQALGVEMAAARGDARIAAVLLRRGACGCPGVGGPLRLIATAVVLLGLIAVLLQALA